MRKISLIIFILFIAGLSVYGGLSLYSLIINKDTPPLPPIDVVIPDPDIPEKPDCSSQDTIDERISCEIKYYSDDSKRVIHFVPKKQPSIFGSKEQNNQILWKYLDNSSYNFLVAQNSSYLVVITKNPLAYNRDMLLGVLGRSQGAIHKNAKHNFISDLSVNKKDSLYIFPVNSIQVIGLGPSPDIINLFRYRNADSLVPISIAVGEANNFVTDIYILNL